MNRRNLFAALFGAMLFPFVRKLGTSKGVYVCTKIESPGTKVQWVDYPPTLGTVAPGDVILLGSCTLKIHRPYK